MLLEALEAKDRWIHIGALIQRLRETDRFRSTSEVVGTVGRGCSTPQLEGKTGEKATLF